jgi:hypothetical protein
VSTRRVCRIGWPGCAHPAMTAPNIKPLAGPLHLHLTTAKVMRPSCDRWRRIRCATSTRARSCIRSLATAATGTVDSALAYLVDESRAGVRALALDDRCQSEAAHRPTTRTMQLSPRRTPQRTTRSARPKFSPPPCVPAARSLRRPDHLSGTAPGSRTSPATPVQSSVRSCRLHS